MNMKRLFVPSYSVDAILQRSTRPSSYTGEPILAIGASTGGTEALRVLLSALSADFMPVLVAQHMPEMFTKSFAERLNSVCALSVKEAENNERLRRGQVYIAPGSAHMVLENAGGLRVSLNTGVAVNRHRPSVDVLFRSVANVVGGAAIGILLTGMGRDGAQGLLEMREAGAYTIAQDKESCVVFGMPKEAINLGAAKIVLPLNDMAEHLRDVRF